MITRVLTACVLFGLFINAHAAGGDPVAGEEKAMACQGCHGMDGNSPDAEFPSLAGQQASYIIKQLKDFNSGKRSNEIMQAMASGLEEQDMVDVAAFFSAQKMTPAGSEAPKETLARGRLIYKGGNKKDGMAACAGCHGPKAMGNGPAAFPALAGQHAGYTVNQLLTLKTETRKNDVNHMMRDISTKMSVGDMEAVAAYLANLAP